MACKKLVGIIVFRIWQIIHYGQIVCVCVAVVEIDNKIVRK